jgi:hypothetical protein
VFLKFSSRIKSFSMFILFIVFEIEENWLFFSLKTKLLTIRHFDSSTNFF